MDGIFISYRRDDSAGYAGRLYDRLSAHFGTDQVFMDVAGIELGTDFVTAIEQAVGSCKVLIVVIGDEWLTTTDAAGRRRLDDPHDFVRLETSVALEREIRVVPVLVGGALMPRAEELPPELKSLARRQAIVRRRGRLAVQRALAELTDREREIASALGPTLAARGLLLVGLDVIGDCLTEINVTSPTCFQEITDQTGFDVPAMFIDALEKANPP